MKTFLEYHSITNDKLVLVDTEDKVFIKDDSTGETGLRFIPYDEWMDARTFDLVGARNLTNMIFSLVNLSILRFPNIDLQDGNTGWYTHFGNYGIRRKLKSSLEVWVTNGCDIREILDPESFIDEVWTSSRVSHHSHTVIFKIFKELESKSPGEYLSYMMVTPNVESHSDVRAVARILSEYRNSRDMVVKEYSGEFFVASRTDELLVEARLRILPTVQVRTFTRESLVELSSRRFDLN